ncbi:Cubilin, partial [Orchesella cincta]
MELKTFYSTFCIVFVCFLLTPPTSGSQPENHAEKHLRKSRSIKDALPKDDEFSNTRIITDMRHKIFSLEGSMKRVTGDVDQLSKQNEDLEKSMLEQKTIMEKIDGEFSGLQKLLSAHGNLLSDIEQMNQTCGGVLQAQSGSIVFSRGSSLSTTRYPSSCVWTVRANNRALIKVSTHPTYRTSYSSYISNTYVLEIIKPNATGNANSSQPLQTKITKLQSSMHHVFTGPIIFVVTSLLSQNEIDLHLQFEGIGKLVEKNTFFSHETLFANSGNFSSNELETWSPSLLAKLDDNANYTLDYTTIVHLQAVAGVCSNGESFIVITDVMENSTVVTDCCKTNCKGTNSLINYDNPFVILITKKFQQPFNFNLTWEADPPYPSSSNSRSGLVSQCGEVLGGSTGTIMYKPHASYRSSERCIWVIVPQPRPRSSIVINVGTNGIESTYDHLYMMELTDVNGVELSDAPRITRLGRYGTYEAESREVYIVFYSDSSVSGYGFSLTWRATGDFIKTGNDVSTQFTIIKRDDGSASSMSRKSAFTSSFYQVFIFTPVVPSTYSYGLQLQLNQTLPVARDNDCIHKEFSIFTAVDGILTKTSLKCDKPGEAVIQNADGLTVIVMNSQNASSDIGMDFKWRQ